MAVSAPAREQTVERVPGGEETTLRYTPLWSIDMEPKNKPTPKPMPSQKKELERRINALRGKYKGKGLMNAFLAGKKREKELENWIKV